MLAALLLSLLTLPPRPAAHVAAAVVGVPADALVSICERESRCQWIGVHARDVHRDGWRGQVALGHLRPWCQPWRPRVWTTWGVMGLSAASNHPYLPPCYQPEVLAIPIVSAFAAALRFADLCQPARRSRWCPIRAS